MSEPTEETLQQVARLRGEGLTPKAIAKKLALRPAQVSDIIRKQAESQGADKTDLAQRPVVACLVNSSWKAGLILDAHAKQWPGSEAGSLGGEGLVQVLVARAFRYDKVLVSTFLLDVYCLGAKSVIPPKTMVRHELEDFINHSYSRIGAPVVAPLELAQNLVLGSIEYARALGFEPDVDFEEARPLLGEWTGSGHIKFGREGKPFFVNGPHDDVAATIATLDRTVGNANYEALILG